MRPKMCQHRVQRRIHRGRVHQIHSVGKHLGTTGLHSGGRGGRLCRAVARLGGATGGPASGHRMGARGNGHAPTGAQKASAVAAPMPRLAPVMKTTGASRGSQRIILSKNGWGASGAEALRQRARRAAPSVPAACGRGSAPWPAARPWAPSAASRTPATSAAPACQTPGSAVADHARYQGRRPRQTA